MKSSSTIRTQLLDRFSTSERQGPGGSVGKEKPTIVIDMTKVPTISKERWESIDRAARNPSIKLRGQAILRDD